MKITIAQLNPTVGALDKNFEKIKQALLKAQNDGSTKLVLADRETILTGYPTQNLSGNQDFQRQLTYYQEQLDVLVEKTGVEIVDAAMEDNRSIYFQTEKSPFYVGKENAPISNSIYMNLVGAQGEVVFDGGAYITGYDQKVIAKLPKFVEAVETIDSDGENMMAPDMTQEDETYNAMMLGLRDYAEKNGMQKVLLGLSGGIDSAIVATIAADALGAENVNAISLPSRYTSDLSNDSASDLAKRQGLNYQVVPVETAVAALNDSVADIFDGAEPNVAEENIQARIRGNIIMAIANKFNYLVLNTGNASEDLCGYFTIDGGDDIGGYNPVKDLFKTDIRAIAKWRNANIPTNAKVAKLDVIPVEIIERAPSAELSEGQEDTDNLPDYEVLDPILKELLEGSAIKDIVDKGFKQNDVETAFELMRKTQFKREKVAPGVALYQSTVEGTLEKLVADKSTLPLTNGFTAKLACQTKKELESINYG